MNQKEEETYDDRGRDGGTNFILRIKEQETCLTLQERDDDDDDDERMKTANSPARRYLYPPTRRHAPEHHTFWPRHRVYCKFFQFGYFLPGTPVQTTNQVVLYHRTATFCPRSVQTTNQAVLYHRPAHVLSPLGTNHEPSGTVPQDRHVLSPLGHQQSHFIQFSILTTNLKSDEHVTTNVNHGIPSV